MAETFRGAFLAVPVGLLEAGYAYGMSKHQVFFRILVPQMMRHALPGLGNNWLVLMKVTALVSVIGLHDLVFRAGQAGGTTREPFLFYLFVALMFLAFTPVSIWFLNWLERSEEHTSELQSLMRISYAVFCLNKQKRQLTDYNIKE